MTKIVCTLRTYQIFSCLNHCLSLSNHEIEAEDMNNLLRKTSVVASTTESIREVQPKSDENLPTNKRRKILKR